MMPVLFNRVPKLILKLQNRTSNKDFRIIYNNIKYSLEHGRSFIYSETTGKVMTEEDALGTQKSDENYGAVNVGESFLSYRYTAGTKLRYKVLNLRQSKKILKLITGDFNKTKNIENFCDVISELLLVYNRDGKPFSYIVKCNNKEFDKFLNILKEAPILNERISYEILSLLVEISKIVKEDPAKLEKVSELLFTKEASYKARSVLNYTDVFAVGLATNTTDYNFSVALNRITEDLIDCTFSNSSTGSIQLSDSVKEAIYDDLYLEDNYNETIGKFDLSDEFDLTAELIFREDQTI